MREQIAQYRTGGWKKEKKEEMSQLRSLPFYLCPTVTKYGDFLKKGLQGFMETSWTKTADFVVKAIENSMAGLGITIGTCVGIKKLSKGQNIEIGKIVLVCLKEKGKEICTLKKYYRNGHTVKFYSDNDNTESAKTSEWEIIGIAVDIYKGL